MGGIMTKLIQIRDQDQHWWSVDQDQGLVTDSWNVPPPWGHKRSKVARSLRGEKEEVLVGRLSPPSSSSVTQVPNTHEKPTDLRSLYLEHKKLEQTFSVVVTTHSLSHEMALEPSTYSTLPPPHSLASSLQGRTQNFRASDFQYAEWHRRKSASLSEWCLRYNIFRSLGSHAISCEGHKLGESKQWGVQIVRENQFAVQNDLYN